jgi:YD repeat-containing protein
LRGALLTSSNPSRQTFPFRYDAQQLFPFCV